MSNYMRILRCYGFYKKVNGYFNDLIILPNLVKFCFPNYLSSHKNRSMSFKFEILENNEIQKVVPLVEKLNDYRIPREVLDQRFSEMAKQNYECAIVLDGAKIIGVCGLWYCTRHYAGSSVEVDHVYIEEAYRGHGVGKAFFKWIYDYITLKGCEAMELNTYVSNHASHKFYYNEDFKILGYHFLKKF